MAKVNKLKAPTVPNGNTFKGFLNIQLTDDDKAAIKRAEFNPELFESFLEKKIDSGYKFTFSYDTYNRCFQVIGAFADKFHEDYGILVSGRGSTAAKAFKQWCYIVDTLIDSQPWDELRLRANRPEIDD